MENLEFCGENTHPKKEMHSLLKVSKPPSMFNDVHRISIMKRLREMSKKGKNGQLRRVILQLQSKMRCVVKLKKIVLVEEKVWIRNSSKHYCAIMHNLNEKREARFKSEENHKCSFNDDMK